VSRYKPYGDSALTSDGYGISDWVIWNEPNLRSAGEAPEPGDFWTGSLEEYILLLRFGYEGAHAADPDSNVLNAGLADVFWSGEGLYLAEAVERLYDPDGDGDASDGGRPFFDTLNIHSYQPNTPDATWYQERLAAITQVMERFGDAQKPIWITETGYGTLSMPAEDSQYVDDQTQAAAVPLVYATLSAYPQVERVFWWSLRDYFHDGSTSNQEMEGHYGLLRADFGLKPAYLAYGRMTGRLGERTTLRAVTDEEGVAHVTVPASFVSQPGTYLAFASVRDHPPSSVVTFEASADRAAQD
jgi:hypothetical protein